MSAPDDDNKLWATKFQIKGERYSADIRRQVESWVALSGFNSLEDPTPNRPCYLLAGGVASQACHKQKKGRAPITEQSVTAGKVG